MMFIEVFVSGGAFDTRRRQELGERLIAGLMADEGAPESVVESSRALTQVVVHTPESWIVGGRQDDPAPRYLVRVTMPGAWHSKEMGAHLIPQVTRVLAEFDPEPERLYSEPRAWVQLIGLREGSLGAFGRPMSVTDITNLITKAYRESDGPAAEAPPGMAIDPICGMSVEVAGAQITLEHEGTTYAFCSAVCKKVYAQELAEAS